MKVNKFEYLKSATINIAAVAFAVIIGVPLGNFLLKQLSPSLFSSKIAPVALTEGKAKILFKDVSQELILFGDTKCMYCKEGVALLDKFGVNYKVYYVDTDPHAREIYDLLKVDGVPVLLSKRNFVIGFNQEVWESLIKFGY